MKFNTTLFKELLAAIEYRLTFDSDGLDQAGSFCLKCSIDINELLNNMNQPNKRYDLADMKYCVALLKELNYINVSVNGLINKVTPSGFKFIMYQLHGVDCKY